MRVIALVGNQNCGKTTLFNRLTGAHYHVGNYPGVTVCQVAGRIRGREDWELVDLPGTYSLRPHTGEEAVTRDALLKGKLDGIINIVDAASPQRGLYLTLQLLELGIPTVLALNMMDEVERNGGTVDISRLSQMLGIPVAPISAARGQGLDRLLEGLEQAVSAGQTPQNAARDTAARYAQVDRLCGAAFRLGRNRQRERSQRIDRVLTHRIFAIPIFLCVMLLVFWLTFHGPGAWLSSLLAAGLARLTDLVGSLLTRAAVNSVVYSLVIDGIFAGVGSVLSFLPLIVTLFFLLSMLEDTGYMARVAFVLDAPMRKLGLSGRMAVPLLTGFGCTVPAVLATRTAASDRERRIAIGMLPFLSCSAKIPIYGAFAATFFPSGQVWVMAGLYALGIALAALAGRLARQDGEELFLLELPSYRLPRLRGVLRSMWERAKEFFQRAFTMILLATVLVWFLQTFDLRLHPVTDPSASLLAGLGRGLSWIFRPLGFSDWRPVTALLSGFLAKEGVIASLHVLMPAGLEFATRAAVCAFLVFTLLYTPCVAALAAIRRELGGRDAVKAAIFQCATAWVAAFVAYRIALLVGI